MRAIILATLVAGAATTLISPTPSSPATNLALTIPETIAAGQPAQARVTADGADGTPVSVLVVDALGSTRLSATLQAGVASFPLPARARETAGVAMVVAAAGTETDTASMRVISGDVVEPVVPLLGARSIVADGSDQAMVVIIPEDRFGNPQPDGTAVGVAVHRENGSQAAWAAPVTGGVAWTWIPASTDTGRTLVAATSGDARGPAAYLHEVPASPARVVLYAERATVPADGQSLVVVETGELVDGNGNRLLDGTAALFTMRGPGQTRAVATAVTVGGRASTIIRAPETPGTMEVNATVGGVGSRPVFIEFTPVLATQIPIETRFEPNAVVVTVGPLLGTGGTYLPDGTRVTAVADHGVAGCMTDAGRCSVQLPVNVVGSVRIAVAGREAELWIGAER